MGCRTGLRARGGSLTLVASALPILQIFRITGVSDVFAVHSCVPDAITADQHWQEAVSGAGDSAGGVVPQTPIAGALRPARDDRLTRRTRLTKQANGS